MSITRRKYYEIPPYIEAKAPNYEAAYRLLLARMHSVERLSPVDSYTAYEAKRAIEDASRILNN